MISTLRSHVVPAIAACVLGCGAVLPSAFAVSYANGQRAEAAGRWQEAAAGYDEAASASTDERQKDDARYHAAIARERAGDVAGGGRDLLAIASGTGAYAQEAAMAHALLLLQTNDPAAASELDAIIRQFPNEGLARRALALRVRSLDASGVDDALAYLASLESATQTTEVGADVVYQQAIRVEQKGEIERAHAMYLDVATRWPYPQGALFDDALWRASLAAEKLSDPKRAVADLETMLQVREQSQLNGSYDRPRFPDALIRVAKLQESALHDDAAARAAWQRFTSTFTSSPKLDLALWNDARLAKKSGDVAGACSELTSLVARFPDSRYVPCAIAECKTIARPEASHAPAQCHAYLARGD